MKNCFYPRLGDRGKKKPGRWQPNRAGFKTIVDHFKTKSNVQEKIFYQNCAGFSSVFWYAAPGRGAANVIRAITNANRIQRRSGGAASKRSKACFIHFAANKNFIELFNVSHQ